MSYLATLTLLPLCGGVLALALSSKAAWARSVTIFVLLVNTGVTLSCFNMDDTVAWIPAIGASFHFRLDGLSFVLVLLANAITLVAALTVSEVSKRREGLFFFLLLTTLAGMIGIFISFDLLLFFVFWEVMLVPLYFLILLFGEEQRQKAATRFLILTQGSGLLLLISIIALYSATKGTTFDYFELLRRPLGEGQLWISLGFLAAFLVKLPAVPFHFWMPSIFANAPVSALLTGILIKTGAYGLMRFYLPLFPQATQSLAPVFMIVGIVGLIFGAVVAYSQRDMKKILAYSTISHVGLILAGIFSGRPIALTGVTILLITQALGTGALLMLCNHIMHYTRSRELGRFSGLYQVMPKTGVMALFFAMASIGLPGLGNFVGEWFVLRGLFTTDWLLGSIATIGIVLSALYMLRFVHSIFFGKLNGAQAPQDLPARSVVLFGAMALVVCVIGLYPSALIQIVAPLWPH